eukprot:9459424-Karenia_brevis.AAC.1
MEASVCSEISKPPDNLGYAPTRAGGWSAGDILPAASPLQTFSSLPRGRWVEAQSYTCWCLP